MIPSPAVVLPPHRPDPEVEARCQFHGVVKVRESQVWGPCALCIRDAAVADAARRVASYKAELLSGQIWFGGEASITLKLAAIARAGGLTDEEYAQAEEQARHYDQAARLSQRIRERELEPGR